MKPLVVLPMNRDTEYLRFSETTLLEAKTRRWAVLSMRHGDRLGVISRYGPWQQYVFRPALGTLFNKGCLADIELFLADATTDWREHKAAART